MILKHLQNIFFVFERFFSYLQGKGYGASSIKQEVNLALRMTINNPTLAIDIGGKCLV